MSIVRDGLRARAVTKRRRAPVAVACVGITLGALAALPGTAAHAASTGQPTKARATPETPPPLDPKVVAALDRMGKFLQEQKEFSVRADTTTDQILNTGQKVQFTSRADMWVRRPNRFRADIVGEDAHRLIFFDGQTFTQYQPETGYYAQFPAPSTIAEAIGVAKERYNVDTPLADLFYWGTSKSALSELITAIDLGPAVVEGVPCQHYALHQKDVDWQVWIADGDRPVPRKLVVTTLAEKSEPQFSAVLSWDLSPKLKNSSFEFEPPKGAKKIVFEELIVKPLMKGTP